MKSVWFVRGKDRKGHWIWWQEAYESEDDARFERDLYQEHAVKDEFWQIVEIKIIPDSKTV